MKHNYFNKDRLLEYLNNQIIEIENRLEELAKVSDNELKERGKEIQEEIDNLKERREEIKEEIRKVEEI